MAGEIFRNKLAEPSKGTLACDQFPGAQRGQGPQMLEKIRAGDIDFNISSTANASTVQPESGVMSVHWVFRSEDHLAKAIADPGFTGAVKEMFNTKVQGAHVLTVLTLGFRNFYSKKEIHNVGDLKCLKVRVQATATEDALFPAYGAQIVHMPFGDVYTSLQTAVVDVAEDGINVYMSNKHYEVAPIMSMSEHEANDNCIWVSDKAWGSFSAEQT